MGIKLVTFYPGNAEQACSPLAMILLSDPETGEPLAVMDGKLIIEMRTAAASPWQRAPLPRRTRRCWPSGSGVQARVHVEALRLVRDFREVRIWGRTPERAATLAAELSAVAAPSAEEAVRGADVVVTATSARTRAAGRLRAVPH